MIRKCVFTLIFLLSATIIFAQIPSLPSNLASVKSADISEEQLTEVVSYLQKNNITTQQAYNLLVARGMEVTEAGYLKSRIENAEKTGIVDSLPTGVSEQRVSSDDGSRKLSDTSNKTITVYNPKKIFGLEIFNNGVLSFEPNIRIATPVGYIIGPDDELNINIYGYQEAKYSLRVGPDGDINIPYVGVIYVAGLTIEQATAKIKARLSSSGYSNIRTGLTKVNVSIGRIRSIKVTILGEVKKPGTYTLPSLATAFNALYLSGGPTDIGSMRDIQVIRNGAVIAHLDIYDFLIKGDSKGNVHLNDQDIIRIPAYTVRVSLEGQVKRTGLFEIKEGESLQDLFDFAGGFSDSAYTASITAYKTTDVEKRIIDINKNQFGTYKPSRSEAYVVKKIVGRFINRVSISGAVYLPGDYELTEGMTIKDLIVKARGLKQDAYNARGLILRESEDLTPEYLSFSPTQVASSGPGNIALKPNDRVSISSVTDIKEKTNVSIYGEVRNAGVYPFIENMSLKDLILLAGGFTDAAIPQRIEVARRLRKDTFDLNDVEVSDVFDIRSVKDLQVTAADIKLAPYDAIIVRKNPGYQVQSNVRVEGEVLYPGPYVLANKNERISDIIKRAGGLTKQAYEEGVYVTRINSKNVLNEVTAKKVNKIQATLRDTTGQLEKDVDRNVDQIAVDLASILENRGSKNDLILEDGDVITIPKEKMDVRISGQVLFPTRVIYDKRLSLKDYLGRAGGVTDNARKGKVYVLYANGNAAKTSHFLFFRQYPKVAPGSEVIVPKKHEVERRRLTTGEVIGITTAITSFAGVLLSLIINLNK
jgi:protein involved in polysaccharide export with SLBB domain